MIRLRLKRLSGAQRLFQPPADPIALDRAADASGDRQADARARDGLRLRSLAPAGLQRKGLDREAPSARDALKLGSPGQAADRFAGGRGLSIVAQGKAPVRGVAADRQAAGRGAAREAADQAESFLRPRARRAASTLRPPTVAMRARKP